MAGKSRQDGANQVEGSRLQDNPKFAERENTPVILTQAKNAVKAAARRLPTGRAVGTAPPAG